MNIYISRGMKSYFASVDNKYRIYGGKDIIGETILRLTRLYPQHTFYYNGANDLDDLDTCPKNVVNLDKKIKTIARKNVDDYDRELVECTFRYIEANGLEFDMFLMFCFITETPVEYWKFNTSKGTPMKPREMDKSSAYKFAPLKHTDGPIYYYTDDTSCFKWPRDVRIPARIFSQYRGNITLKQFNENTVLTTDYELVEKEIEYQPIELFFLRNKKRIDWRNMNKTGNFEIICNQSPDNSLERFYYIKKWILDYRPEQIIYGKWTKKNLDAMNEIHANVQEVPMIAMEDKMFNTKYTFVIPANTAYTGFVTQKVYSMLYYGIVPFWCKNDYDTTNIYSKFPDYIKVENPEELYSKINELEADDDLYHKLLEELYDCFEDYMFSDDLIYNMFDSILNPSNEAHAVVEEHIAEHKKLF